MSRAMDIVSQVGQLNIEGNVIPHAWFTHLRFTNGKPHVNAAILLSEILYWYRPIVIKDEATGRVIGIRKKFKADKLQRSYDSFAQQFGFTKRQVKDALKFLEDKKLVTLEFRHISIANGTKLANVLFIEPVPKNLKAITHLTLERDTSDDRTADLYTSNGTHPTVERQTNTETPTEITTEITTKGGGASLPPAPARADSRDPTDLPEAETQAAVLFGGGSAGVADPSQDGERWLNYKSHALKAYKELTGLYPDKQVGKPAIGNLAGEPGFDLQKWRSSIETCKLGGVNPRNIACMIDTYRAGGDYGEMQRQRKNGGKPDGPNQRPGAATGPRRDTLSDEQRRLLEGYRRTDTPP